jgi:hypothetical protein
MKRATYSRRKDLSMSPFTKVVFWFVAANALVGAGSLTLFPAETDRLFFWGIEPPINAGLFGMLYLGGAAVVGMLAYLGRWEPARFLIPILVSAGVMITATTLLHLDLFTPGPRLAYWLVVYVGAPLLAVLSYTGHERRGGDWTAYRPITPATRGLAITVGAVLILLGVLVLVRPTPVVAQWPWPITPLMVRIFASWFAAFGMGLLWFWVERDWDRVRHVADLMIAASGLDLLMVLVHREDLTNVGPNLWLYCSHLAMFGLVGLLMHRLQRKPVRSPSVDYGISVERGNGDMSGPKATTTGRERR